MTENEFVSEIEKLKQSDWFNDGKTIDYSKFVMVADIDHIRYLVRKEAVETVCDLFKGDMTKQGHWSEDDEAVYCSVCGSAYPLGEIISEWIKQSNYCYRCGAKMDEEVNNNGK